MVNSNRYSFLLKFFRNFEEKKLACINSQTSNIEEIIKLKLLP